MNTMVKSGFYKVFVSISALGGGTNYAVHATTAFRVVSPLITMTTYPNRRRFIQGEVVDFDFYNPYFDFDLARNEYRGHISYVVDAKFPNPMDKNPKLPDVYEYVPVSGRQSDCDQSLRIVLPPGMYKVAIFRVIDWQEFFATSMPSTYFRVVQNNFTLITDKDHYTEGESIRVELASSRNIPLSVEPQLPFQMKGKVKDDPSNSYSLDSSYSFDQLSLSGTKLIHIIKITWDIPGIYCISALNGLVEKEFEIR